MWCSRGGGKRKLRRRTMAGSGVCGALSPTSLHSHGGSTNNPYQQCAVSCTQYTIYRLSHSVLTLYNVASEFVGVGSWAAALACASSTARTASSAARSNAVAPPRSRIVVSAFASSNTRTQSACRYLTARCKAVRPRRFRALSWAYSASSDWMIPAWPCFAACQGCCRTHDINNRPPTSRVPPRQARRTRTLCSGVLRRRS